VLKDVLGLPERITGIRVGSVEFGVGMGMEVWARYGCAVYYMVYGGC
jgi:hypothetical protein